MARFFFISQTSADLYKDFTLQKKRAALSGGSLSHDQRDGPYIKLGRNRMTFGMKILTNSTAPIAMK